MCVCEDLKTKFLLSTLNSDSWHTQDELSGLLEVFNKSKETNRQATLSTVIHGGKTMIKLVNEIVSPSSSTAPTPLQPVPD